MDLRENVLELIRRASTDLSPDAEEALKKALLSEEENTPAHSILTTILENVELARKQKTPMCQDTGSLVFYVDYPERDSERTYRQAILWATEEATRQQLLRPNAVDPISGRNSGTNLGENAPYIHFRQWNKEEVRIRLLLKGGGSENVGAQYKLPHATLHAGRDLQGVRKVVIDAVRKAQGLGCAPGIIGVGIGGGRDTSYALSKEQFFRKIGERSPDPHLAALEEQLLKELNSLQIGPMGLGGKTTVLEVFMAAQARHPATYYVSISYNCWAFRRKTMSFKDGEVYYD